MKRSDIAISYPKEVILIRIVCIAWLVAKIISWKVWTADRLFPVIPVFDFLTLSNTLHVSLFTLSIIIILAAFLLPNKKELLLGVILIEITSCLLDQMRWQPWEYQYILIFSVFVFSKNVKQFLLLVTFLVGVTYVFSGLHKLGGSFLYFFWDNTILHYFFNLPYKIISEPIIHYSGLILPLIEIFIGVGIILFSKLKKYFGFLAITMHLVILLIYGPFGLNQNSIIFPWNLAMIAIIMVLSFGKVEAKFAFYFFKSKLNTVVFLLIGIMPIFSFINSWDQYLSFNFYSGNTKTALICVEDVQHYPELKLYLSDKKNNKFCGNSCFISTNRWALEELKVPVYPEVRTFKVFHNQFKRKYPKLKSTFVYYTYPYKKENSIEIQ